MKFKAALMGSFIVLMSVVFAACGGADDGKITTTKAPATSAVTTTRANTTHSGVMNEMSSAAGEVSEGLSDAASEIRSDIRGMLD